MRLYFFLLLSFCCCTLPVLCNDHKKYLEEYRKYYDSFLAAKDPNHRLSYADSALYLASLIENEERIARSYILKAVAYRMKGELYQGIDFVQKGVNLYASLEDSAGVAAGYQEMATIFRKNGEYRKSQSWYLKSLKLYEQLEDSFRYAAVNVNYGECMREWSKPDSAIIYYKIASTLFGEINSTYGVAYANGNIGLAFIDLSDFCAAKIYLEEAIELLSPFNDKYAISSYQEGLSRIYLNERNYSKAIESARISFRLAREHGLKEQIRDASLTLANIYNAQKQYDKAYQKHCEYVAYRDSINNEETVRKIADLRTKYEVAQKQKEVDALVNQKQRYTIIGISLFVVLGLLLAHVGHLYRNRKLRKRDAIALTKQHKELELANDTKNKFFSILSHDLRSPIATFNSYSEVLNYYLETNDYEQIPELAKELERSSASVVQLLDNLLQWGVIQMKNIKINKVNVPILQVFQEELIHIHPIANSKDIQIQSNIASDLELYVDKPFFAMAMRNLISNSLKFTNIGGFITVSAYRELNNIIIKVADTGVGLNVDDFKERMCNGEIVSTYGTNNEKGLGLGMQLVCSFIKVHDGEIDVESTIGKGTTFILKFNSTPIS